MESSSEITDLKKMLSDLKAWLSSIHLNENTTQHHIRKLLEKIENGYVKDEETLHQQRREATRTIEEAKREAAEDRDAARAERDAARADAELKMKDADTWRKRTMEEIELHSRKRHEDTTEQILRQWEPKETEHKANIAQLMMDQAQVMHEKELLELKEARYRADIVRLTADQNKITQDKALLESNEARHRADKASLESRVNQCLDVLTAAQATKTWVTAKYAALTETLRSVEVEKSQAREMLQQADVVMSKAKEIRSQVSEKLDAGKQDCNEVGEQLRSQEARLQSQRSNMSELKAELNVHEGKVTETLQGFEDSVTDTHKNLTNVLCKVDEFDDDLTVLLSKVDVVKIALADLSGKVDEVEIAPLDSSVNKLADSVAKIHVNTNNASKSASALQKTTIGMQATASSVESEVEKKCAAALEKVSEVNEAIAEAGTSLKGLLDQFEQAKENVRKSPEKDRRRKIPRSAGTPDGSPSSSLRFTLSPSPRRTHEDRSPSRPGAGVSSQTTLAQGELLPLPPLTQQAGSSSTTAPAGLDPQIGGSAQTSVPSSRRIDIAAAPVEVRKIWGQIDFSPELQHPELEVLLDLMKTRSTRKTANHQTPLALLEKVAKQGGCLVRSLKKLGSEPNQHPTKACGKCSRPNDLCVGVAYTTDQEPGEYDDEGTGTRWKVTKRAP